MRDTFDDEYAEGERDYPHFGNDVEAIHHEVLDVAPGSAAPESTDYPYVEEITCSYGTRKTGTCGDCHYVSYFDQVPDVAVVANADTH